MLLFAVFWRLILCRDLHCFYMFLCRCPREVLAQSIRVRGESKNHRRKPMGRSQNMIKFHSSPSLRIMILTTIGDNMDVVKAMQNRCCHFETSSAHSPPVPCPTNWSLWSAFLAESKIKVSKNSPMYLPQSTVPIWNWVEASNIWKNHDVVSDDLWQLPPGVPAIAQSQVVWTNRLSSVERCGYDSVWGKVARRVPCCNHPSTWTTLILSAHRTAEQLFFRGLQSWELVEMETWLSQ